MRRFFFSLAFLVFLLAFAARPVSAHAGEGGPLLTQWSFDPLVLLGAGLAGLIYARGRGTVSRRGAGAQPPRWPAWAFAAGLAVFVLALISPLDTLAEQLFSAHMGQHIALMLAAPPLLALSRPLTELLLGLPRGVQHALGRLWRNSAVVRFAWRTLSRPLVAALVQTAVLWGWHAPALYTASVENDFLHALQHLSLFTSALLFWWVAFHSYGSSPERRGAGIVYLFVAALQSGLLGALITFSPAIWYPVYAGRTQAWGLAPLADQQLAGTLMWVPAGLVFLTAALTMLKAWIDSIPSSEAGVPQKEVK